MNPPHPQIAAWFFMGGPETAPAPVTDIQRARIARIRAAEGEVYSLLLFLRNEAPEPVCPVSYGALHTAAWTYATVINNNVPDSADKSAAIRNVRLALACLYDAVARWHEPEAMPQEAQAAALDDARRHVSDARRNAVLAILAETAA